MLDVHVLPLTMFVLGLVLLFGAPIGLVVDWLRKA